MQTLLLYLVPFIVAVTPAKAAAQDGLGWLDDLTAMAAAQDIPDEPFDEAALVGWAQEPPTILVAERNSTTRITLRVLGADGKTVRKVVVDFAQPGEAPEFKASVLRKWDKAMELMKAQGMERGRSTSLEANRKGLFHHRFIDGERRYLLTTSAGTQAVLSHPVSEEPVLFPYFVPGGEMFALVGRLEVPDSNARGIVIVKAVKGGKALSAAALAESWFKDAQNRIDVSRYAEAGVALHQALQQKALPRIHYLAALVDAYLREWDGARAKLAVAVKADPSWADKAEHEPLLREARLRGLDINGDSSLTFKASKGYEGTSVWVKVKNAEGRNIAIFKPTNGNTYHRGEVFTYQMAKVMGTEHMYPVTMLHTLDKSGCDKFIAALDKVEYKGMKERNRQRLMKKCAKGKLEGAVKEWVSDFQFFQAIGTQDRLKKHKVFHYLNERASQPPANETVKARTVTKYYKPDHCRRGTYKGTLDIRQLAVDVSNLLIMDVLNANEDRFPGANVDFKSLGKSTETSECVFDFGPSRLFSLDNGATFKGTYSNGYVDFTKRLKPSRFDRRTYQRLKSLDAFIKNEAARPQFIAHLGIETVADLSRFLALDKGDGHKRRKEPFKLFTTNLGYVLSRLDRFADREGAWFK